VDEVLAASLGNNNYRPIADGLGSAVALTNRQGKVVERYRFSAYGAPQLLNANYELLTTASTYRLLFTGREWLTQVRLNDHRNRYYSPEMGRWLTTDPLGFDGRDVNLMRYVHGSPSNAIDPSGLMGGTSKACKKICKPGETQTIYSTLSSTIYENFAAHETKHTYEIEASTDSSISGTVEGGFLTIEGSFSSTRKDRQSYDSTVPARTKGWYEQRASCTCSSSGTFWSCSDAGLAYRETSI